MTVAGVPIQRVCVPSFEHRTVPDDHVVYAVRVELPVDTWVVFRRHSEFVALDAALSPPAPPAPLPPKHAVASSLRRARALGGFLAPTDAQRRADDALARERRPILEQYLRAMLSTRDDYWREHAAFHAFLDVPAHTAAAEAVRTPPTVCTGAAPPRAEPPPPAPRARAAETGATRTLSNTALLGVHTHAAMNAQDEEADRLGQVLARQREIGLAIHNELGEQRELLRTLDSEVQDTRGRVGAADSQIKKLKR
ncbi:hypothetical protein MSPP1_003384 [Malassezia sp. CBS 17886]|nr:hypothetical protein MSPP1_003384 [Malassezia sp. CBS 17886]